MVIQHSMGELGLFLPFLHKKIRLPNAHPNLLLPTSIVEQGWERDGRVTDLSGSCYNSNCQLQRPLAYTTSDFFNVSLRDYLLRGFLWCGRNSLRLWKHLQLFCHSSRCILECFAVLLGFPVPRDSNHGVCQSIAPSRDFITSPFARAPHHLTFRTWDVPIELT